MLSSHYEPVGVSFIDHAAEGIVANIGSRRLAIDGRMIERTYACIKRSRSKSISFNIVELTHLIPSTACACLHQRIWCSIISRGAALSEGLPGIIGRTDGAA